MRLGFGLLPAILVHLLKQQETRVIGLYLEADGLLDVLNSELPEEALVLTPEQPDVWDAVKHHGQPLQAQTEGPTHLVSRPHCKKTNEENRFKRGEMLTYQKVASQKS